MRTPGAARSAGRTCGVTILAGAAASAGSPGRRLAGCSTGDAVIDESGQVRELALALPGRANRSNAVVALAVAAYFGATVDQALPRLREVKSVAGRYTQVERHGRTVRLLLAKNPAGWLEALDILAPSPGPVLLAVNAQTPDGKDTSWLWDVDYRVLQRATRLRRRRAPAGPGRPARGR